MHRRDRIDIVEGDHFVILTNSGGAEDFRICSAPVTAPDEANWQGLVPHRPRCLILDVTAFERLLVGLERRNGLPRLIVREVDSGREHPIAFAEEAYALGMSSRYEYATTTLRFTY